MCRSGRLEVADCYRSDWVVWAVESVRAPIRAPSANWAHYELDRADGGVDSGRSLRPDEIAEDDACYAENDPPMSKKVVAIVHEPSPPLMV